MPTKKRAAQLDREIAEALLAINEETHAVKRASGGLGGPGRWIHRTVAQNYNVPEDVVRRIYTAVQLAKKQGLHGGHYVDLVERSVGRKLMGNEYTISKNAKQHLGYDPPGGYQGSPEPKGAAKVPPRAEYNPRALQVASRADRAIELVLQRRKTRYGWDTSNEAEDRALLREAADELEVAADLYEGSGSSVTAGTLRERARLAREGVYTKLEQYT